MVLCNMHAFYILWMVMRSTLCVMTPINGARVQRTADWPRKVGPKSRWYNNFFTLKEYLGNWYFLLITVKEWRQTCLVGEMRWLRTSFFSLLLFIGASKHAHKSPGHLTCPLTVIMIELINESDGQTTSRSSFGLDQTFIRFAIVFATTCSTRGYKKSISR